jgi:alpha/beta superfamily hydrolase
MDNPVVVALARSLSARGVLALRLNFRGVGRSEGQHDNGRGEKEDIAGALDWLFARPDVDPECVSLVGYSFGAWVGLAYAQDDPRLAAVAAVSLVAWHYDAVFYEKNARLDLGVEPWQFDPDFLADYHKPKFFVTGERDRLAPPDALRRLVSRIPPPASFQIVPHADHFWRGIETEPATAVASFVAGLPGGLEAQPKEMAEG